MKNHLNILFLFILLILPFNKVTAIELNTEGLTDEQRAIIDTAKAFYYRGPNIQYFSASLTYKDKYGKKSHEYHIIPEDATEYNILDFDCTSFIYSVYENAFEKNDKKYMIGGLTAPEGVSKNFVNLANPEHESYNQKIAIFYTENVTEYAQNLFGTDSTDPSQEKATKFINDVDLQPGDIIVYTKTNDLDGHALLYLGGDVIINTSTMANNIYAKNYVWSPDDDTETGDIIFKKRYSYNDYGAIGIVSLENNVIAKTQNDINHFIFDEQKIAKLAIIRPLNEIIDDNYSISSSVSIRKNYSDLIINKTSSTRRNASVNLGDKITYTIKLDNVSETTDYSNVTVTDIIPTETEYVSLTGNGTRSSNNLSWNLNIPHGESITISYTVRVKRNTSLLGTYIISDGTKVNGMSINTISTYIKETLTNGTQNRLANIIKNKAGTIYTSEDNIINVAYKKIDSSLNIFSNKSAEDIFDMYFTNSTICLYLTDTNICDEYETKAKISESVLLKLGTGNKTVYKLKANGTDMHVKNMFGGVFTLDKDETYDSSTNPERQDDRIVRVMDSDFQVGDILIIHDDDYLIEQKAPLSYAIEERNIYLYIGNGEFAALDKNNKLIIINEKAKEAISLYDTKNNPKTDPKEITRTVDRSKLVDTLPAQNAYIVLRPSYSGIKGLLGDVNSDGAVEVSDLEEMAKYIIDGENDTIESELPLADINNDGIIKMNDVMKALKEKTK